MLLEICTILGGIAAIWFFWDKIPIAIRGFKYFRKNNDISILSLPDEEFILLDKLSKSNFKGSYQPISVEERQLCNSLVNYGILLKKSDSSFLVTKEGKKIINST
jgi:hypothetical protein